VHQAIYDELLGTCSACADASSRVLPTGARFIKNLADKGPLAFLHCLYAPLTRPQRERCEAALGRNLPRELAQFMERANGATLFDKAIYLFGYVERVTRSLALEDQAPISLTNANEVFAASCPDRWREGWMHFGSLTGWSTSLSLQAHSNGECAIVWDDGRRVDFTSFPAMLCRLVERIGPCFTCTGIRDQTYRELEATLNGLLVTH